MTNLRTITAPFGARVTVDGQYANQFGGLFDDLTMAGYPVKGNQSEIGRAHV